MFCPSFFVFFLTCSLVVNPVMMRMMMIREAALMEPIGGVLGDPHFLTLDGTSYTFNGYGEYTYLGINNQSDLSLSLANQSYVFMSQIRTIPLVPSNATVIKGFAARSNTTGAESVSFTIDSSGRPVLHRENKILQFQNNANELVFPEMNITRLDGEKNSHFAFSWTIGVLMEINVIKMRSPSEQLVLNVITVVDRIFLRNTYGLLGTHDDVAHNDLRNKYGQIVNNDGSLEEIHKEFGTTWAIEPTDSLFYYEPGQSAQFFAMKNREFLPSFLDPANSSEEILFIRSICKINATSLPSTWNLAQRACYYDLARTNDTQFAQVSLEVGNELLFVKSHQQNPPSFHVAFPSKMELVHAEQVHLNFSASSDNSSNVVRMSALHLPKNAQFDMETGAFRWKAVIGHSFVRIQAHDITYNLTTIRQVDFYVKTAITGGSNRYSGASFIIFMAGLMIFLLQ